MSNKNYKKENLNKYNYKNNMKLKNKKCWKILNNKDKCQKKAIK